MRKKNQYQAAKNKSLKQQKNTQLKKSNLCQEKRNFPYKICTERERERGTEASDR
jgi:predicted dithiol-disulfide oxidoreductase (DUF899 family)